MFHTPVCRLCLATDVRLVVIANTSLQYIYEKLTNLAWNSMEKPKGACYLCVAQLRKCQKFTERVIKADGLLTRVLESGSEITLKSVAMVDRDSQKLSANLSISRIDCCDLVCCEPALKIKTELPCEMDVMTLQEEGMQTDEDVSPDKTPEILNEENQNSIFKEEYVFPEESSKENTELALKSAAEEYQTCFVLHSKKSHEENFNRHKREEIGNENITKFETDQMVNGTVDENNKEDLEQTEGKDHFNEDKDLRIYTEEKPYACPVCEYRSKQKVNMIRHFKTHTGEKPYGCTACEYRCSNKTSLKAHLIIHTGETPYECKICEYKCHLKGSFKRHLKTHTGEKPYECTVCGNKFREKSHLKTHLRTHTGEKPYECALCGNKFSEKCHLKTHLGKHTGEKPHECPVCKYRCHSKRYLKAHLRTHSGVKPYKCTECDYSCQSKGNLNRHLKTHTGEKPFECGVCGSQFSEKGHVKRHLKTHTGEKPFECTVCGNKFSEKSHLKRHLITHTGEKPYGCTACDYRCSEKRQLRIHLETHI